MTIISQFRRSLRRAAAFAGPRLPGSALCGAMALCLALSTNARAQTDDPVCVESDDAPLCLAQVDDIVMIQDVDFTMTMPAATGGTPSIGPYFLVRSDTLTLGTNPGNEGQVDTSGLGFSPGPRLFSGRPAALQGATEYTYGAWDDSVSVPVTVTFTVTIAATADATLTLSPADTSVEVSETAAVDTPVGVPPTPTGFPAGSPEWSIPAGNLSGNFKIDASGQLAVARSLDFETTTSYTLTIQLAQGGEMATIDVTIMVTDVNEAPRAIFGPIPPITLHVGGPPFSGDQANAAFLFEDDEDDALTFSAESDDTAVATVSLSGSNLTITPVAAGTATITLMARDPMRVADSSSETGTHEITVTVEPAVSFTQAPRGTYYFTEDENIGDFVLLYGLSGPGGVPTLASGVQLPDGLSIVRTNNNTAAFLRGTPTAQGETEVRLSIPQTSLEATFNIVVRAPADVTDVTVGFPSELMDVRITESGGSAEICAEASAAVDGDIDIALMLSEGTALEPEDYGLPTSAMIRIDDGATEGCRSIPIVSDAAIEPNEQFFARLGSVSPPATATQDFSLAEGPNRVPVIILGDEARLSALALSGVSLSPTFDSDTMAYTGTAAHSVASLTVTPTASDAAAANITVNEATVDSGATSGAIPLTVGDNTITIEVTAGDGTATEIYTVTVTRASTNTDATLSGLTISPGSLTPAFAADVTSYAASVGNDVASVTVTPTVANNNASVTVNDDAVNSGMASSAIPLTVGENTITIEVTAGDGTTMETYTVTVTRAPTPSAEAMLSGLTIDPGTLLPAFAAGVTSYTATVATAVTSVTVTPTAASNGASIGVTANGETVTAEADGTYDAPMAVGENIIAITVTAGDGSTVVYTVAITRTPSPDLAFMTRPQATYNFVVGESIGSLRLLEVSGGDPDQAVTIEFSPDIIAFAGLNSFSGGMGRIFGLVGTPNLPAGDSQDFVARISGGGAANELEASFRIVIRSATEPFVSTSGAYEVAENAPVDTNVGAALTTSNFPAGSDGMWSITAGDTGGAFKISDAGQIQVASALDHETTAEYTLTVQFARGGAMDATDVTIIVTNVNEPPPQPVVANQDATVGSPFSYPVRRVNDPDGDTVTYRAELAGGGALPGWLNFDAATPIFSGTPMAGDGGVITVRVTATDDGSPPMSSTAEFTITVTEGDAPTGTSPMAVGTIPPISVSVDAAPVDQPLADFFEDRDGDTLTYSPSSDDLAVATVVVSGSTLTITPMAVGSAMITVTASDPDGRTAMQTFAVTVTPVNTVQVALDANIAGDDVINIAEHTAGFSITGTTEAGAAVAVAVGGGASRSATVSDTTWTVDIPASASEITGDAVEVVATATLSGKTDGVARRRLSVDLQPPTATYAAPASLMVGVAIASIRPGSPSGDTTGYAVQSGTLPPGLALDAATGAITGTPTTVNASTAAVTIRLTDSSGNTGDVSVTFPAVDRGAQTLTGFAYTPAVTHPGGPVPTLTPPTVTPSPGGAVTYMATPGTVCTVNSTTGALTLVGSGTCVITATAEATAHSDEGMASFNVTINRVEVSISDAEANEEDGEIVFTVSLTGPPIGDVMVRWTTAPGSALDTAPGEMEPADFTGDSGVLTFPDTMDDDMDDNPLTQQITISLGDDSLPEREETFEVRLEGTSSDDVILASKSTGTGRIRASDGGGVDEAHSRRVNDDVLPRVARAMASGTLSAIAGRIDSAVSGVSPASASNLAGTSTLLQALKSGEQGLEDGTLDLEQALAGSSFVISLNAAEDKKNDGVGAVAVWGSGDYRTLSGPDDSKVDWDGDLFAFQLGADIRVEPGVLAGVAVSRSSGSFDYADRTDAAAQTKGSYDTRMTSVHPYVSWSASDNLGLWATLGYGQGEIEIDEADQPSRQSDTEMQMMAVGASHKLLADDGLIPDGTTSLKLKGQGSTARIEVDSGDGIPSADYDVQRLRLALEGSYECSSGARECLSPSVEAGIRHDSGDGATGTGVELGAGLRYTNPGAGLTVEGRGRALVAGQDGSEDWGVGGLIRIDPGADRLGLSFSLTPGFGDAASKVERLYNEDVLEEAGGGERSGRLETEIGYGFASAAGVMTPYTGVSLADAGVRSYRLGGRFVLGSSLRLSLEGTRRESGSATPDHGVMLRGQLRW